MPVQRLLRKARFTLARPLHRRRLQQQISAGQAPMMVPFYHRVADSHPNPWTISRARFARHVDHCLQHLQPRSLADVQQLVRQGNCRQPTVTFTFDDGYAENCDFALPLLLEKQIPCTYFVTLSNLIHQQPFSHDRQRGCPLPVNNLRQIRELADVGIEIGLHSRDHIDFSTVNCAAELDLQIGQARTELEQRLGHPVRQFAFPFGMPRQLTAAAIAAVDRAGLHGFSSAFGGYNLPGRDAFHLRRFHGDCDFNRFRNWISFDPRKVRSEPTIRYQRIAEGPRAADPAPIAAPPLSPSAAIIQLPGATP
ncbi:polysaccharide deacetylase family protein [Stieleria sp. TO1_6]|uniref:polysaccharide deacetylase family protein n=1 Tax=Stieleria tagensis TaxID=2956795 RepID=UPI00209AEB23|nr:polysaccharide deacetylase family protein [Stieleria tagensis]MCO8121191.1 polysaccharide deacetylase family protein [Stieleria tagensis]